MRGLFLVCAQPEFRILARDQPAGRYCFQADLNCDARLAFWLFASVRSCDRKMFHRDFVPRAGSSLILSGFFLHNPVSTINDQFLIAALRTSLSQKFLKLSRTAQFCFDNPQPLVVRTQLKIILIGRSLDPCLHSQNFPQHRPFVFSHYV